MKIKKSSRRFKSYKSYKKWAGVGRKFDKYGSAFGSGVKGGLLSWLLGQNPYNGYRGSYDERKKLWKAGDKRRYKYLSKYKVGSARVRYGSAPAGARRRRPVFGSNPRPPIYGSPPEKRPSGSRGIKRRVRDF